MSAETNQPGQASFSAEDAKLVTLARAARARTGAAEAAALRDTTGRTYVAVAVDLPSLRLPALAAVVVVGAERPDRHPAEHPPTIVRIPVFVAVGEIQPRPHHAGEKHNRESISHDAPGLGF